MAQSSRLLDYVEPYNVGGFQKTKIYTELNTNYKLNDRIFIVGGNFDNYTIAQADPYAEFAMGYTIVALNVNENWIVIDRNYDGTSVLASPTEEAFLSRGYFRKGEFNGGSFNDGIFGNDSDPTECLFNNKQVTFGGAYIPNAFVTHCVWLNGTWHEGEWKSKTGDFGGNFKCLKANLNNLGGVTIDELTGSNKNNYGFGYNLWVDGTWENGHWFNGTWETGTWEDGEWDYGIFKSGTWIDGIKHDGVHSSLNGRVNWLGGTHENGTMNDCFWENGTWENGTWNGANNFKIASISVPVTAPYIFNHYAVKLDNNDYLSIFQPGDEFMLSFIKTGGTYDNNYQLLTGIVQDVTINDEIIFKYTSSSTVTNDFLNADYTIARISNSRWRHGVWENGNWNSGYRRAGFETDIITIDDTIAGQLSIELTEPVEWSGTIIYPDFGIEIGDIVTLTNVTDSATGTFNSEDYPLTISGIIYGSPTTVVLTGAPIQWQSDLIKQDSNENVYMDNTIWENGKFNGGAWENGYFKLGEVYAKRNETINDYFTHWKQGQWSLARISTTGLNYAKWNRGIWKTGVFKNGEWLNGIWKTGYWDNDYLLSPVSPDMDYSAIWRNGTWENGTWIIGRWDNGTWLDGAWLDGIVSGTTRNVFNNGSFLGGTWENGVFNNGLFKQATYWNLGTFNNGTFDLSLWNNGIFNNGTFQNSTWMDGDFNNGSFLGNIWNNGDFNDGFMTNTTWNDGFFYDGLVTYTTINEGQFLGGVAENCSMNDGILADGHTFNNGVMNGGTINGAIFNNSIKNNGTVLDGQLIGSSNVHNGGDFLGGEWFEGLWNNGLWDTNIFEGSNFRYSQSSPNTNVYIYETNNVEILTNGHFTATFTGWTVVDPEWTIVTNAAQCQLAAGVANGTYLKTLTQTPTVTNLVSGLSYRIKFDIVSNTHPINEFSIPVAPANKLTVQIGTASYALPNTEVGEKEIYLNGSGLGALNFNIIAEFLKLNGVEQTILIDNVSIEQITSDTSDFTVADEVWTSNLSYKINVPDPFSPLNQKGLVVSTSNRVLTVQYNGTYIIGKTSPTQEQIYASNGIWRNGTMKEGDITGIIFKNGNLTQPNIDSSAIENGNALYQFNSLVFNSGLSFLSSSGWTGLGAWTFSHGIASCSPTTTVPHIKTQAGVLTNNAIYRVSVKIYHNQNHLEDYVSIFLGNNEYYLGSAQPDKTYTFIGIADGTDFKIKAVSKRNSKINSSVKLSNLVIQQVGVTEMTNTSWLNGTANGVTMDNCQWIDGTLTTGLVTNTTWEDGTCDFGTFYNCIWKGGTFNDGTWNGDQHYNAIWEHGAWSEGLFLTGEWKCGYWTGGAWEDGFWRDGSMSGNTKFHNGVIQYGNITKRQNPIRIFNVTNLNSDANSAKFNIVSGSNNPFIQLTAGAFFGPNIYPSNTYDNIDWGGNDGWAATLRSTADWVLDDKKIILRDVLEYNLNGGALYLDNWDVDFVTSNSLSTANMSGDGMTTSPNNQSANYIRVSNKNYVAESLNKSGSSAMTHVGGAAGVIGVQIAGGTYVGYTGATAIPGNITYRSCADVGGNAQLWINNDLTSYVSNGDYIYMYGTGKFDDDLGTVLYKDGLYHITAVPSWNGTYTTLTTDTPITGTQPGFVAISDVEIWVDPYRMEKKRSLQMSSLLQNGRYLSISLKTPSTDLTAEYKKDHEISFQNITNASVLARIKNGVMYKIKRSYYVNNGGINDLTVVVLDVKVQNMATINSIESIETSTFALDVAAFNFCLGGGGPSSPPVVLPPGGFSS